MNVAPFFDYARKRYNIMLDKNADWPKPWTDDPILQQYRFCNVFREDDTTTAWFRDNIRDPLKDQDEVLLATVIFRWFNKIETAERLLDHGLHMFTEWKPEKVRAILEHQKPLINGAYMIKTPAGMNKLEGIIKCIDDFVQNNPANLSPAPLYGPKLFRQKHYTLEMATKWLSSFPYLGPFMAYEIVTDLRHTDLLKHAEDINKWANPGPGAARGLSRLMHGEIGHYNRHSEKGVREMMELMQEILILSRRKKYWPERWPRWEMREVEHTLCEFDKYERVRLGQGTPKQLYKGTE